MNQASITPSTIFKRNETDFLFTEIDNETVLMNINTSAYFGLNKVATDLWNMLEHKTNFNTIITNLLKKYKIDKTQCESEVKLVLEDMIDNKVLYLENK